MVKRLLSAVICARNDERTIADSVQSFLNICTEVIVVVNNSTDNTWNIVNALKNKNNKCKLITLCVNGITDLSEARRLGHSIATGNWIIRADGDFVCYGEDDGVFNPIWFIKKLSTYNAGIPTVFYVPQLNVFSSYFKIGDGKNGFTFHPYNEPLMPRIYSNTKLLQFTRLGRNEGVRYLNLYRKVKIEKPLWIHATLKTKVEIRLSHNWRRDWRELGDYDKYPTLDNFVDEFCLPKEYGPGVSLEEASKIFYTQNVEPALKDFDFNGKWPIPNALLKKYAIKL